MLIAPYSAVSTGVLPGAGSASPVRLAAPLVRDFESHLISSPAKQAVEHRPAKQDAFTQLEAVFLRNFVEAMLPAEDAGSFGTGSAGEYWRSMLADEMAQAVAKNGQLGIADTLRKSFRDQESKV